MKTKTVKELRAEAKALGVPRYSKMRKAVLLEAIAAHEDYDPAANSAKSYALAINVMRNKLASFRQERIGDCWLIQGDCREVLPLLPKVDAVITSPPYNLGNTSGGGFPKTRMGHYSPRDGIRKRGGLGKWAKAGRPGGLADGYGTFRDNMPHVEYVAWQHEILRQCWELLSKTGAIFYNHKPRVLDGKVVTPLEYNPGLPVRQIIIWARAGGVNFSPAFYLPTHEWVVILAKEDFRLRSKGASGVGDVWYIPQEGNTPHPAPFPVELPARILETTTTQTVLDPFCGSGTTGVACVKLGRRFIGIECEPKYFDIACKRIRDAYAQPDMFIQPPTPKSEQLALQVA